MNNFWLERGGGDTTFYQIQHLTRYNIVPDTTFYRTQHLTGYNILLDTAEFVLVFLTTDSGPGCPCFQPSLLSEFKEGTPWPQQTQSTNVGNKT